MLIRVCHFCCGSLGKRHLPTKKHNTQTDLFSRRFWEGISFPSFVQRSIPELRLSKLCTVPFALQNRALFEGRRWRKCAEERGGQQTGQKGKKDACKQVSKHWASSGLILLRTAWNPENQIPSTINRKSNNEKRGKRGPCTAKGRCCKESGRPL